MVDREHILEEIRRTAESNNGIPLGRRRFESETGTKSSDWLGRYWSRWGDALVEAGFKPNQFQDAIPLEHVLAKYAEFARELGRLPVEADLRMKARTDPDFPSHSTIARLGPKTERVHRLLEYCRGRNELGGIAKLCEAYRPSRSPSKTRPRRNAREDGFVYMIKSGRYYKIGKSNAAGRRERELAIQLPEPIKTVHIIKTDDPAGIETYWHQRFAELRRHGEWFELDASAVAAFKRRKFM